MEIKVTRDEHLSFLKDKMKNNRHVIGSLLAKINNSFEITSGYRRPEDEYIVLEAWQDNHKDLSDAFEKLKMSVEEYFKIAD